MRFYNADLLWELHLLEQQFRQLFKGVVEEMRYIHPGPGKAREAGRASGFQAAAEIIADKINKLDRSIK
jgi:hypothetical protein